jgi:UPF0148 protein
MIYQSFFQRGFDLTENQEHIKIMADLLKQGATLTKHACPACSSPIFKLTSGDLWCASCQKRVVIVKKGEPEPEVSSAPAFSSLELTLMKKIQDLEKQLAEETDLEKLNSLGTTLSTLLESLEKIRNTKK